MPAKKTVVPAKKGLDAKTVEYLAKRAAVLNISGRSSMDKKQLVKAIRSKNGGK